MVESSKVELSYCRVPTLVTKQNSRTKCWNQDSSLNELWL